MIQKWGKISDMPAYRRVLTLPSEDVPLSPSRRRCLAAIELEGAGRKSCILLATPEKCQSPDSMDVASRLRALGWHIERIVPASSSLIHLLYAHAEQEQPEEPPELDNTEIEETFSRLIAEAKEACASDIHVICKGNNEGARIRLRIHGELRDWQELPAKLALRLCSCAYNSIAEDRDVSFNSATAQDANIRLSINKQEQRLRYAHAPSHPQGFHAVLRLLGSNHTGLQHDLREFGFLNGQAQALEELSEYTDGSMIVAGSTGSGKSTTVMQLLTRIQQRNEGRLSILSVEDPPEYNIQGVIQSPVISNDRERESRQHGFERMIRSSMRRDPDVLMIGEIRDLATALCFIQAVQSGHLCISTLHARDCFAILSRLEGLGAHMPENPITRPLLCEPGFLRGLVWQRLLPRLCPHCSKASNPTHTPNSHTGNFIRRRGLGCAHCMDGINGRLVCSQIVLPESSILEALSKRCERDAIKHWERLGEDKSGSLENRRHGVHAHDVAMLRVSQGLMDPDDARKHFGDKIDLHSIETALPFKPHSGIQQALHVADQTYV
ncbi:MAG: GspE/PulE family protein [Candidatus Eutrophobiaceae bacterium]